MGWPGTKNLHFLNKAHNLKLIYWDVNECDIYQISQYDYMYLFLNVLFKFLYVIPSNSTLNYFYLYLIRLIILNAFLSHRSSWSWKHVCKGIHPFKEGTYQPNGKLGKGSLISGTEKWVGVFHLKDYAKGTLPPHIQSPKVKDY